MSKPSKTPTVCDVCRGSTVWARYAFEVWLCPRCWRDACYQRTPKPRKKPTRGARWLGLVKLY